MKNILEHLHFGTKYRIDEIKDITLSDLKGDQTVGFGAKSLLGFIQKITTFVKSIETTMNGTTQDFGSKQLVLKTMTPVNAIAAVGTITLTGINYDGDTYTIGRETYELDSDGSVTEGNIAVDISAFEKKAKGTYTASAIVNSNSFTIGSRVYVFDSGDIEGTTDHISIAALTTEQILAVMKDAINGVANPNHTCETANADVEAISSNATTVVVQALEAGTGGNSIILLETGADTAWDGSGVCGGTQAGANCDAAELDGLLISAINNNTEEDVVASQGAGTTVLITCATKGIDGNDIAFLDNSSNSTLDGSGLLGGTTAGVDGTVGLKGEIVWDDSAIYICTDVNTIADANWKRTDLSTV